MGERTNEEKKISTDLPLKSGKADPSSADRQTDHLC
jgi:hypothetical protein